MLCLVAAIDINIDQVVDEIDARRAKAESKIGNRQLHGGVEVENAKIENGRNKQQGVFQPLMDPDRLQPDADARLAAPLIEPVSMVMLCIFKGRGFGANHDGAAGPVPDLKIGTAVANIVKTLFPKPLDQSFSLCAAGQVGLVVGGLNRTEQFQMICNGSGIFAMGCCGKNQFPPGLFLLFQPFKHGCVKGQALGIGRNAPGNFCLHVCLALEQPDRKHEQIDDVGAQQHEDGFMQQVGVDQGAIKVHAKRNLV